MKKNNYKFRFTLAFFVAMLFGAANLQAAEYDLKICGVQVTDANKGDLTVINGTNGCTVTGIVNYNSTTNTLTLNGATIKSASFYCFSSQCNGLKIELIGNNTITAKEGCSCAIHINNDVTIQGSGTLNVSSEAYYTNTIWVYRSTLTIKKCTVNAIGARFGFQGAEDASLIVNGATVTAKGSYGSITKFSGGITLNGCSFISPADAQIINGSVCDADGNVIKSEVKIGISKYDLWICGEQVTDANKDDLSVINGVTGTVSYNSDSKTLTLNGATMSTTGQTCCILSLIDNMKIDVSGTNNLTGNEWSPIAFQNNTSGTIQGSGTLKLSNTHAEDRAIFMKNGSLTIKNCTVEVTGGRNAIFGDSGEKTLTFDNATITASLKSYGVKDGTIMGFKNIKFVNCGIFEPARAVFNNGIKAICDADGNIITDTVKIKPIIYYDLWICDVQVTNLNKDDLSVINGVEGSVSYNPDTKTLKLEDATICATGELYAINNKIENLKIDIVGNNNLSSVNYPTVHFSGNSATIDGSGTLNINAKNKSGISTFNSSSLTIRNCTVNTIGKTCGFAGDFLDTLTIENATVSAIGTNYGSIRNFNDVELISCVIVEPAGAVFNPNEKAVCDTAGNIIKDTVKIVPAYIISFNTNGGTAVDNVTVAHGNKLTEPEAPTKEGYTFASWYSDPELQNEYDFNTEVTSSFTLYAKWQIKVYTITFNTNGGSTIADTSINHGDKLTEPETPTKEGYTFIGWFTDTELQNEYDFNTEVTSSFTLYAKWDINSYAVTIAEGITNGSLSFIPASPVVFSETVTITASADDGYKLKDGSLRAYKTGEETEEVPLNGMTFEMPAFDVTITAEFEEIPIEQFTIAFATPENGTISVMLDTIALVSGDKVDKNSEITITATPDNGYKLKTLTVNGNPFESGNTHIVVADVNIVAEFVEETAQYTVTYNIPEHGTLSVTANGSPVAIGSKVDKGAAIIITATPNPDYKLQTLTLNGETIENGSTHIVVADVNIVAEFVETSIEDFAAQNITVYPNPVQDILHIETKETITTVSVYNMLSSIVAQNTGDVREINISSLPAGIYMVRVEMGESVGIIQIVKK